MEFLTVLSELEKMFCHFLLDSTVSNKKYPVIHIFFSLMEIFFSCCFQEFLSLAFQNFTYGVSLCEILCYLLSFSYLKNLYVLLNWEVLNHSLNIFSVAPSFSAPLCFIKMLAFFLLSSHTDLRLYFFLFMSFSFYYSALISSS